MDESAAVTAAAAASKKKPVLSSRLVGRGSRSNRSAAIWSSRRPPERLDWPTIASSVGVSVTNSVATGDAAIRQEKLVAARESSPPSNSNKRQRRQVNNSFHLSSTQTSTFSQQQSTSSSPHTSLGGGVMNSSSNALWTEKYAPREPSDLVVAPKKVEQVSSWIQSTLDGTSSQRLLVLVGSPGIGKSSMIHCLAARQQSGGFHVLEWTESFMTRTNETWQQQYQNGNSGFMTVEQPSPIHSFEAFLQQAAVGYSPLTLQTSSSSQQQHPALSQQHKQSKRTFSSLSQPQRKMAPSTSSNNNSKNNSGGRSVILLDELPHCHDDDAKHKFRNLLTNLVENSVLPCILIFSNVLEGKHKPEDLEQLIEARVLYAPTMTTIIQIHAATKARLKKCLQHICQQEGIHATTTSSKQRQQFDLYQDLHFRSGGDVRFAITTLQYEHACNHNPLNNNNNKNGTSATKKKKSNTARTTTSAITNESSSSSERDQKLSMFHALGKLLYAKREQQNSSIVSSVRHQKASDGVDHRPPLTFDPEGVVEHCGIEVAGALSFLGYHSLDFYTDVEELSHAWDLFSDATYWLDRPTMDGSWYRSSSTAYSAFPVGYASSLAGRAVACTNLHPAPHKFRQFSAPPVFEVLRKRRDNTSQIRHFQSRFDMLTMMTTTTSSNCNVSHAVSGLSHCHPNDFATDLAYMRMILPPEVVATSQLQSHFNSLPALQRRQQEEQETAAALLKEQEEVLREDDIMDFDEDESNNTAGRQGGVSMSLGTENNKPSPASSIENIPVSSAMVKVRFK